MFKILSKRVWVSTFIAAVVILSAGVLVYQYWWLPKHEASIEVISPNGREKWVVGEEHAIVWKNENLPSNAKLFIRMIRDDGGIVGITDDMLPKKGGMNYIWKIDLNELSCWSWGASCIEQNTDEILKHEFKIEVVAYWPSSKNDGLNTVIMDGSNNYFSISQ